MFITILDVITFYLIMLGSGVLLGLVIRILFFYRVPFINR